MTSGHEQAASASAGTGPSEPGTARGEPSGAVSTRTVEQVVRQQLSRALGGKRGMLEGAVPTAAFTIGWVVTHDLRLSLWIGGGAAVTALLLRIVQRSSVQFVVNAFVGIAIAAFFALRSGRAEDAFLPSIWWNAAYFVGLAGSALIRWPIMGFLIGGVTGDPTGWRSNPAIVRLCSLLTWILAIPCLLRVLVYVPLYQAGEVAGLGIAKVALGWPLQVAAFATMAAVLARNHTPLEEPDGAQQPD